MSGAKQERRSVHRRSRYTLSPLASPAALLDVFKAADDAAVQRNPAGAVLQLVRCTQAVGESPLKLGVAGGAGDAWQAAGGAAVCARGEDFPAVLFERWLAVLQQAGKRLPYKGENWETVAGVMEEGRRQLAAAGLACGAAAEAAQQLAATHLAACRAHEAAAGACSPAAAAPERPQQPSAAAAAAAHPQQPDAAQPGTSGRSRRRAAVAAQAAIVAAVEDGEEGAHADAVAGRRRHGGGPAGSESPGNQENAGGAGQQLQRAGSFKLAAKRISGVVGAAGAAAAHAKQALQPAAGGTQQEGGQAAKRQRH